MADTTVQTVLTFLENSPSPSWAANSIPIMVNACTGKMGTAFIEKAETAGLYVVPTSFGGEEKSGKIYQVCGKKFLVQGPSSNRENILETILDKYPDLIVVDFTVPSAVNANAELYCKVGVPFVMGTNGGNRDLLFRTAYDSSVYALIAPQMGKQVVESQQESEVGASETVKAIIPCFDRMGVYFDEDQIESVRDSQVQREIVGIPEEHLSGHACHLFDWLSPDETSMYAEGAVAAVRFLFKKIRTQDDKQVYTFLDVMLERRMR